MGLKTGFADVKVRWHPLLPAVLGHRIALPDEGCFHAEPQALGLVDDIWQKAVSVLKKAAVLQSQDSSLSVNTAVV